MGKSKFTFTALDGDGTEVYVQQNSGTVKEIRERKEKNVADVHFQVEKLVHPIHGWIPTDSEAYGEVLKAQETGAEVSFRIESQRKAKVDKSIPIAVLRKDMATAKENVVTVLVEVNGKYTSEILTNPNEDPEFGGGSATPAGFGTPRSGGASATSGGGANVDPEAILDRLRAAIASNNVRQPIVEQIIALAYFHGVSEDDINVVLNANPKADDSATAETPRASFSYEAQPWKEYNTDGRLNLGNNIIAGAVGVENLVFRQIETVAGKEALIATNQSEVVVYFSELIYAITDSIQQTSYGTGAKVDRSAMSHVRIRGIVYDVVERLGTLPVSFDASKNLIVLNGDATTVPNWIKLVGATARERFHRSVNLSTSYRSFKEIATPESMTGGSVASPKANEGSKAKETVTSPTVEQPVVAPTVAPTPVVGTKDEDKLSIAALQALANSVPSEGTPVETKAERLVREASAPEPVVTPEIEEEENLDIASEDYEVQPEAEEGIIFEPVDLAGTEDMLRAGDDEVQMFQEMFKEYGYDLTDPKEQTRIVKLLKFTFGDNFGNARRIPAEYLVAMVDFYIASGSASLDAAIRKAAETVG